LRRAWGKGEVEDEDEDEDEGERCGATLLFEKLNPQKALIE
jgi:hypothetical protein